MRLFGRKWSIQIDRTLFEGMDMTFSVVKTLKPEPNTCEIQLYNLSDAQRGALEGTPLVKRAKKGAGKRQHRGIPVRVSAGYEEADSIIWQGDLREVESSHNGADWITALGSGEGEEAYQRSRINLSFGKGTTIATVMRQLVGALGLGEGNLALFLPRLSTSAALAVISSQGIVLSGSGSEQLTQIANSVGLEWSIQEGTVQFTERGLPLPNQSVLVSSSSGMVGEPSIDQEGTVTVTMLMVPGVVPGSVVVVDSNRIKGNFRVQTATYEGDTSGTPWYIRVEGRPY